MADGSIRIDVGLDVSKAEKQLEKLNDSIAKAESEYNKRSSGASAMEEQLHKETEAIKKQKQYIEDLQATIEMMQSAYRGDNGESFFEYQDFENYRDDIERMTQELADAEKELKAQEKNVAKLDAEHQKVLKKLEAEQKKLDEMKAETGEMVKIMEAAKPGDQLASTVEGAKEKLKSFMKTVFGIGTAVVLFKKLRTAIVNSVKAFAEYDTETKANIEGLKKTLEALRVSWGAAFAPIFNAVAPLLQKLINLLITAANAVSMFFAAVGGKGTYKKVTANTDALADSVNSVGAAAKDAQKQLMGFDELNILADTSSSGSEAKELAAKVEELEVNTKLQNFVEMVKAHITELELFAAGALLGIGLALLFSGANIPLGLGLTALGAVALGKAIADNWDTIKESIGGAINAIMMLGSGLLFGVGAALTFSGANVPLGLGLMAAGAVGLATTAALNWDEMPERVRKIIGEIDLVIGGGLLAVGALLAFSGANIPLGLGLMVGGAAALAAGAAINWDFIRDNVTNVLKSIMLVAGGAMFAIGLILTLATPAFCPLGIGLMAAGVASLVGAAAINWDAIATALSGTLGLIMTIAGGFMFVIGLILACSGVGIPLGLALMVAGGAMFAVGSSNYNWDALREKIAETWNNIKLWYQTNVQKYLTLDYWAEKGRNIVQGFKNGLNEFLNNPDGFIKEKFGGFVDKVKTLLGIDSPSTVFESIGSDCVEGYKNGVESGWEKTKEHLGSLWNWLKEKVSGVNTDIEQNASDTATSMDTTLTTKYDSMFSTIGNTLSTAQSNIHTRWDTIKSSSEGLVETLKNNISSKYTNMASALNGKMNEVRSQMSTSWSNIRTVTASHVQNLATQVTNRFNQLRTTITTQTNNIKTTMTTAWSNISSSVQGAASSLVNGVSNILSGLIGVVSNIVSNIRNAFNFEFTLPTINLPTIGGGTGAGGMGRTTPMRMATGGYVRGSVFANIGEDGKEAVLPLERNTEWVSLVANSLSDRMLQSNFANRLADAFMSTPMPAMAGGYVTPPNAVSSGFGNGAGGSLMEEIKALRSEIAALSRQPIEVSTVLEMNRREVGKAVTTYQRELERVKG